MTTVLAIETSCDETGVAVLRREGDSITVLAESLASQVDVHALTGGVVPEAAAREHVQVLPGMIVRVMHEAGVEGADLDGIAVTVGPGLMPALAVGVNVARALSYAWGVPLVPVNHLEGHVYSALLRGVEAVSSSKYQVVSDSPTILDTRYQIPRDSAVFPALALLVSGGHTMLVRMDDFGQYTLLGQTRDDAVGEAFDKVARLLGLPYPGGPHLAKLAEEGDPAAVHFARPMLQSGDLDFSFSGLKTEVLYTLRGLGKRKQKIENRKPHSAQPAPRLWPAGKASSLRQGFGRQARGKQKIENRDVAASFQAAVVETLVKKTEKAVRQVCPKLLLLAGGVAANEALRESLAMMASEAGVRLQIAPRELCGDNAVMIGMSALFALERGEIVSWRDIDAVARFPLGAHDNTEK